MGDKMSKITKEQMQRHVKTHTERSNDDNNAVNALKAFFKSGKIYSNFSSEDKWPNTDGSFEIVPKPEMARQPKQNFIVQIKGTKTANITKDGVVKYYLQNLAFPAYIASEITLDPGILFVVLNPGMRNQERIFWKYMSSNFIASIDFDKGSKTIDFTCDDEIENTNESEDEFVKKLEYISATHSYVKQLESNEYTKEDVVKIINTRCENISEIIKTGIDFSYKRDKISRKILTELEDLCKATLLANGLQYYSLMNLRIAWELAVLNIDTKFLSVFLQGLRYIGLKVPEDGQYERLMLKYYNFLWRIREYLDNKFHLKVLENLEDFPLENNEEDREYNQLLAVAIETVANTSNTIRPNRYYIQKKTAFYVGKQRYFEVTLQLADKYATKYNRLTVYTKLDMSSDYSIKVGSAKAKIDLWDKPTEIRVITDWKVSIEPAALNKISKILMFNIKLSSNYNEYHDLMNFLTTTGMNILDFIDLSEERFNKYLDYIYKNVNTRYFGDVLIALHDKFGKKYTIFGGRTIRYALIKLQEDLIEDLIPYNNADALNIDDAYLSKKCYAFEKNPILYNLPNRKTNGKTISTDVLRAIGGSNIGRYLPYVRMKYLINATGELYQLKNDIEYLEDEQTVAAYNDKLTPWDRQQGRQLIEKDGFVYLDEYVENTLSILRELAKFSREGNAGQEQLNKIFVEKLNTILIDETKIMVLKNIFVNSKIMMIYGAAGTGKTTLMNNISDLMNGRRKLFLAKTHTALENLKRRIEAPGSDSEFMSVDKFIKSRVSNNYDVIFVDECSTIDNRTMLLLLKNLSGESLLICAGDIYQIESIDFGNWFFYAKEILPTKSVVELDSVWRTEDEKIKNLWDEVRFLRPIITERLAIDGPFSENISGKILERDDEDEVVLCLNYDGKFGLNSINNYFQNANPSSETFEWYDWKYKVGDPILFNENKRFPMLYNNLKGTIIDIQEEETNITFTIDISTVLTAVDFRNSEVEWISNTDKLTRIQFTIYAKDDSKIEREYEESRMRSIVPFQLAYAVSIHKAQGLEYNSIKIVIPNNNSEKISHGIFYTAITRTKKKLKIFWSADTMQKVISGFCTEKEKSISLDIIKEELKNMESKE